MKTKAIFAAVSGAFVSIAICWSILYLFFGAGRQTVVLQDRIYCYYQRVEHHENECWAAFGFPEWQQVAAFGLLCAVVFVVLRWGMFWRT